MRRIKKPRTKLSVLLFIGVYAVVLQITGIHCPIRYITGYPCPGCGMTRAVIRFLSLDIEGAFRYHLMFWSLPLLLLLFLWDGKLFRNKKANRAVYMILTVGFIVNWISTLIFGIG